MNDLEQCDSELEHDHHSIYGKSLQAEVEDSDTPLVYKGLEI